MNRKLFLGSLASLAASAALPQTVLLNDEEDNSGIIPPYLKKGDTIGITAPAGFITI